MWKRLQESVFGHIPKKGKNLVPGRFPRGLDAVRDKIKVGSRRKKTKKSVRGPRQKEVKRTVRIPTHPKYTAWIENLYVVARGNTNFMKNVFSVFFSKN